MNDAAMRAMRTLAEEGAKPERFRNASFHRAGEESWHIREYVLWKGAVKVHNLDGEDAARRVAEVFLRNGFRQL